MKGVFESIATLGIWGAAVAIAWLVPEAAVLGLLAAVVGTSIVWKCF